MRLDRLLKKTAWSSLVLISLFACQKKKSADPVAAAKPTDINGPVTAATGTLQLSSTVDILPAKTEDEVATLNLAAVDDAKVNVSYYLREESLETIAMAKGIMCFISQTGYINEVNAGPYSALVDEDYCFGEKGGSGDDSAATGAVNYTNVTVDVTRAEGAALVGKVWFPAGEEDADMSVKFTVAEGSSEENPLGIFRLEFGEGKEGEGGFLESFRDAEGRVNLKIKDISSREDGSWSLEGAARLEVAAGKVVGGAFRSKSSESYTHNGKTNTNEGEFKVAFNDTHVLRSSLEDDEEVLACLDREKHFSSVHRYNIYKKDGSLYTLNSGFPIEFTGASGKVVNGHAGYHGMWAPEGELDGVTKVNRVEWKDGERSETPYTLVAAPGKLIEYTAAKVKLSDLKDVELTFHGQGGGGNTQKIIAWNGTKFVNVAIETMNQNGPPERADASGDFTLSEGDWGYNFWVPSLQTNIFIPADAALSNNYEISYHNRKTVSGTELSLGNLVCFSECPKVDATAASMAQDKLYGGWGNTDEGPFILNEGGKRWADDLTDESIIATYTWDSSKNNLKLGSAYFAFPASVSGHVQFQSGALVKSADLAAIAAGKRSNNPWALDQLVTKFYRFETGNQPWAKFTGLKGSDNELVKFDPPVTIAYKHTLANDMNATEDSPYYGKAARLEYGGPGQLWGFPSKVNDRGWYVPEYSLAVGADLGGGLTAVPLEVEQILEIVDDENCDEMSLDDLPSLPTNDEIPAVDNGTKPSGEMVVKYIAGVSQVAAE